MIISHGFQSTASSQKATYCDTGAEYSVNISIHSFLAKSDPPFRRTGTAKRYFNPQLPRKKRLQSLPLLFQLQAFQSTASSQKATANMHNHSLHTCINHSNTHKIIILSASIAVNPIKISNFTSANLPTFYVHF